MKKNELCCLNEVSSIASTNNGAFVAITVDRNDIPWGRARSGGEFNEYAKEQLNNGVTQVKFTTLFF